MAQIDNIDEIAFTTEYSTDKIVDTISIEVDAPDNTTFFVSTPHSFGVKLLPELMWSIDNVNFYPSGMTLYTNFTSAYGISAVAAVDENNVNVHIDNFNAGDEIVYYKVRLLWPN